MPANVRGDLTGRLKC